MNHWKSSLIGFLGGMALGSAIYLSLRSLQPVATPADQPVLAPVSAGNPPPPGSRRSRSAESGEARFVELLRAGEATAWRDELDWWGAEDPAAAWACLWKSIDVTWLANHPETVLRVARHWAALDPAALKVALLAVPPEFHEAAKGYHNPTSRLLMTLARVDPVAAFEVAREISGSLSDRVSPFLTEFSQEHPESASRLAARLPPGEARDRSVLAVAKVWAGLDPSAALAFAQSELAPRAYRGFLDSVLHRVASRDPGAIAPALTDLPEGKFRADWIDRLTATWMGKDAGACASWISQLPEGPDRERALRRVALDVAKRNPAEAIEIARGLSSTTRQRDVLFESLRLWAKQDSAAAMAYAQGLPDEQTRLDALRLLGVGATASPSVPGVETDMKVPSLFDDPGL